MLQNKLDFREDSRKFFWWSFIFLLLAVVLFHGKTIPYSNEYVYLLRLEPNFLPHDWTFSEAANEHWLFNFIFSLPSRVLSIEAAGWLGRITVWCFCLTALLKIGELWRIPFWAISGSIFLWLALTQSVVGEEWIFGGFEAKTVAYVCLAFALESFARKKIIAPSVLLGLSFSFHPAVGLWAVLAVGIALLFERIPTVDFVKIVAVTAVFSMPALIAIFTEQTVGNVNLFEDWRYIVLFRAPSNLDPFQFPKSGMFLLFAMLVFNFFALEKTKSFALRFLLKFQIALGVFFLLGVVLRWFELYPLLRFMPMRLFPVFALLFFIFTAFYTLRRLASRRQKLIVSLFAVALLALLNPLEKGFLQLRETASNRAAVRDDFQKAAIWIAENTPENALVIEPPSRRDVWYFSRRATIVSFYYPTYDRLTEWRGRIDELTNNAQISGGDAAAEELETAYNRLSETQIEKITQKYGANYLVSRAVYAYPVVFETETYKVYRLK
jgi:Domain of unknown function (DUF6798)